jgi:hypothetical protein
VVVESQAKKLSVVQGAALGKPAVVGWQQQLEVMDALVLCTQRWQQELGCYTRM